MGLFFTNIITECHILLNQVGLLGIFTIVLLLLFTPWLRQSVPFYVLLVSTAVAIIGTLHLLLGGSPLLWIFTLLLKDNATVSNHPNHVTFKLSQSTDPCFSFPGSASVILDRVLSSSGICRMAPSERRRTRLHIRQKSFPYPSCSCVSSRCCHSSNAALLGERYRPCNFHTLRG